MHKYDKSTVQALNDAYRASGTWRKLAEDLGMRAEWGAPILNAIANERNGYSRNYENYVRKYLDLPPIEPRRYWRPCLPVELNEMDREDVKEYAWTLWRRRMDMNEAQPPAWVTQAADWLEKRREEEIKCTES